MKPSLCYTYCTLLLVSLVSSCTLFLIVASETLKPTADDQLQQHGAGSHEAANGAHSVKASVGTDAPTNSLDKGSNAIPHKRVISSGIEPSPARVRTKSSSPDGFEKKVQPGVRPLKRPPQGRKGRNTLKKDILTEKPTPQQQDEPPDLKDVIFLDTSISKNVGVTNSGLQDIPGPPSIITLVDNQHHELNNIESKLEENLEATLKNLSHNNVHTVQTTVPLHDGDDHRQELVEATEGSLEDQNNGTAEATEGSIVHPEENEQPLLVMIPTKDPDDVVMGSTPQPGESSSTQEVSNEATLATDAGTGVVPPKQLEVNLTEENPMPVFSEWAQKQMAEAEKKLGEVVNASAMKKSTKPAGSKTGGGAMNLRAKNYAAPECGAKIIASNPEARSTSSVLTAPRDEYLLNPCTSKIWFVVELCEPVQAERIELANFELFSSSPKEFTVSVSNRFPARDWANVGQFTAKDERYVQSFQLHPHLFGKFVRVEILSHYNQEHFCPVSLFRVYGTSEFEAFETDNTPLQPDDDDDDDVILGLANGVESKELLQTGKAGVTEGERMLDEEHPLPAQGGKVQEEGIWEKLGQDGLVGREGGKNPNNILKSAGEVVMNMVKKAAEALGKSGNDSNDSSIGGITTTERTPSEGSISVTSVPTRLPAASSPLSCVTLAYTIRCVNCTDHFRARLESLMNCKHNLLTSLLGVAHIERSFDSAQHFLCANVLGFNLPRSKQGESLGAGEVLGPPTACMNMRYSVLNLLPDELVAGLCNMVAFDLNLISKMSHERMQELEVTEASEVKVQENDKASLEQMRGDDGAKSIPNQQQEGHASTTGKLPVDINHIPKTVENGDSGEQHGQDNTAHEEKEQATTEGGNDQTSAENGSKEDVNMFNIATEPSVSTTPEPARDEAPQAKDGSKEKEQQPDQLQEHREKEDFTNNNHWETIDDGMLGVGGHHPSEIAGTGPSGSGGFTTGPSAITAPSGMATGQQKVQPESVFLRLSNRIKALERNMSLSGQYLEELSRRYRKQVEELQHSYAKTLHEIQEQNLRMADSEMKLREVNERLRQELVEFQATTTDWRNIALAMMAFILLMLFILLAMVRTVANRVSHLANGRTVDKPAPLPQSVIDRELAQVGSDVKPIRGRMLRRKSIDGMPTGGGGVDVTGSTISSASGIIIATGESSTVVTSMSPARLRKKRPSEEALNISGTYVNLLIDDGEGSHQQGPPVALERKKSKHKHRKVSTLSMVANSSAPVPHGSGFSYHEPPRRSVSMIEPQEQQRWRNGSSERQQTPEQENSDRIDELPYLEDNDEFIIPTASDLSYDEYVPGSNVSTDAAMVPNDMERTVNGTPARNGSVPPQLLTTGVDTADGTEPKANHSKSARRLSSPAFFKSSLLRSSLGSKKRSSKKSSNGSSSNNTSSNSSSSNSSNNSNISTAKEQGAGDAALSEGGRNSQDSWYRWWSSEQSKVLSSSTPSSSQEVGASPDGKQQQRQRLGKAKSASPSDGAGSRQVGQEPVKLSVSFNGELPSNGGVAASENVALERKSSRGSIRRLFRKVF